MILQDVQQGDVVELGGEEVGDEVVRYSLLVLQESAGQNSDDVAQLLRPLVPDESLQAFTHVNGEVIGVFAQSGLHLCTEDVRKWTFSD